MIMLKNDEEIDGIRTSGHYLAEMFEEIGPQICAGMSTYDVDKLFHEWMKKRHFGAPCVGYMGYPAATCVSVNDMVIHGIPTKSEVLAVILQAVEKHKRDPRQGRRSGAEGTCTLMVQVGADGRVVSCSLAEPSGRTVLDAASRRLGEKLVGLDVGSSGSLRVLIPVHYRLTDR